MTAADLINKIRPKVGDIQGNKWDDPRIIQLINEGLDDLARKADIRKGEISLPVLPYQRTLNISDDRYIKLLRVTFGNEDIDVVPFVKMDKLPNWQDVTGPKLLSIVYNLQNNKELILYPLIDEGDLQSSLTDYIAINNSPSGVLVDIPGVERDSSYGIITSIDVEDFLETERVYAEGLSGFEPVTGLINGYYTLNLQYTRKPDTVSTVEDIIDLDESYETALIFYVSGMLLFDDTRSENINKGTLFIGKYKTELMEATDRNAGYYQVVDENIIDYRNGFEGA